MNNATSDSTHSMDSSHAMNPINSLNIEKNVSNVPTKRYKKREIDRPLPPPKTTLAAVIMFLLGSIFLVLGFIFFFSSETQQKNKGLPFIILGGLIFVPGSYACFIIYGSWQGWPGFDYSMIPSYDDE